jgi:glycosyltransferase involved in cell wall biosynthesis
MVQAQAATRVAILHPADPAGHVPSGIDSFIRGILQWAPEDLDYTLIGASSDLTARPVGRELTAHASGRAFRVLPIVAVDAAARRQKVPLIVRYCWALRKLIARGGLAQFDIVDFHRIEPIALLQGDRRPKNATIHQDMTVIRDANSDILWKHWPWLYETLEHRLFRHLNRVFTVRQTAVERYRAIYSDLADRFQFIPTWFDPEVFYPLPRDTRREDLRRQLLASLDGHAECKILISVGRLDRQKDPELLLHAFAHIVQRQPGARLLLVGDGILRPQLESMCQAEPLRGKVRLLGALPPREIARLLQASDLFVMSSAYEGMPFVVLEALATGLPVATTDVGELRLVVTHGVNGAICTDRSPQSFADTVSYCLSRLDSLWGEPCVKAVASFHPKIVLQRVYENHRQQGAA